MTEGKCVPRRDTSEVHDFITTARDKEATGKDAHKLEAADWGNLGFFQASSLPKSRRVGKALLHLSGTHSSR